MLMAKRETILRLSLFIGLRNQYRNFEHDQGTHLALNKAETKQLDIALGALVNGLDRKKFREFGMSSILSPKHHRLCQQKIHAGAHRDIISLRKEYIGRGLQLFNDAECHCRILRPVDSLFVPHLSMLRDDLLD